MNNTLNLILKFLAILAFIGLAVWAWTNSVKDIGAVEINEIQTLQADIASKEAELVLKDIEIERVRDIKAKVCVSTDGTRIPMSEYSKGLLDTGFIPEQDIFEYKGIRYTIKIIK